MKRAGHAVRVIRTVREGYDEPRRRRAAAAAGDVEAKRKEDHMPGAHPRLAIVTGADSGMGKATAELLATEGFDVAITYHTDRTGAEDTKAGVEQRGGRCFVAQQDLKSPDTGDVVDELVARLGGLGVLVNNAGTGQSEKVLETSYERWRQVLATDLDGPFLCARRAAEQMVRAGEGGRIINVTSVHEYLPRVGSAAYCAAKAGLGMLTKVLSLELAQHAITVNSVAPGEIATPMTGEPEEAAYDISRPGNPLGRPGHVNEVASVIAFLASPRSTYVTGTSITVDGGLSNMAAHGHDVADASWRQV
jgi:NAD(P)-dependent dehydrogenase (short-subunit alcohol dehydrogenase family)